MFGSMFKSLMEPFVVSATDAAGHESLRYYYGEKVPNAIYSGPDRDIPLEKLGTTYLGNLTDGDVMSFMPGSDKPKIISEPLNRKTSPIKDEHLLPTNSLSMDLISERQAACEGRGGISAIDQLTLLASNVDANARLRCGWMYDSQNPVSGRGAYGTIDGPFSTTAKGTWMWNLPDAKKKLHAHICSQLKSCGDVDNASYAKYCGFCTNSGKGVPVVGSTAAYAYDPLLACPTSAIVLTANNCPKPPPPPPPGSPAAAAYVRGTCDPLTNGALPRDCLIAKARDAGCSDQGAIIEALKYGSDGNYLDTLQQAMAYTVYQSRASQSLNETALKSGKITQAEALSEFQNLKGAASSAANNGLKAAAVDLCFNAGTVDKFDFCTEIQPTTQAPFGLDCLQKEFMRRGGQKTGELYPNAANANTIRFWNSLNTWKDVTNRMDQFVAESKSTDRATQQDAINKFYGVPMEDKSVPALGTINNVEIFWFTPESSMNTSTTPTFLGRRIRSQIPMLTGSSGVASAPTASFVYFTNVVPSATTTMNMRVICDSGFTLNMNSYMQNIYSGSGVDVGNKEFSALTPVFADPNTIKTATNAWTFQAGQVNILTGSYMGNGNNYVLQKIVPSSVSGVPEYCGCYGKPGDNGRLRMYAKDECENGLNGNWHGSGECIIPSGGSYSWNCRGLNNFSTCGSAWSVFPGANLYLIQDPYAPMISFQVVQNYGKYNAQFYFMDKRLSAHKLRWVGAYGSPPPPAFVGNSTDTMTFPLKRSYMQVRGNTGLWATFLLKLSSFTTMTIMARFTSFSSTLSAPLVFWASYPDVSYPSILLTGNSNGQTAKLNIGDMFQPDGGTTAYGVVNPPMTKDGPTVELNTTYIITLKMVRSLENDINSLYGMQIGAAKLSDLQSSTATPSMLKESSILSWGNKLHLNNPTGTSSHGMLIRSERSSYDLFGIDMYDYSMPFDKLRTAAKGTWGQLDGSVYA